MSHALLLRLFLSPSFFSVHVALQYLTLYVDNIGITYYLTGRLRELDIQDLREVWGFICHLLVTRPSRSRALECFVVDTSQKSTHIAMLTLWFMQAYLRDLSQPRQNPRSFLICQRVLHQCHEIIFGDLPIQSTVPYAPTQVSLQSHLFRRKVRPHVQPALVGIGMVLAGVLAMPKLTAVMGNVAIEQGRIDEKGEDIRSLEPPLEDVSRNISSDKSTEVGVEDEDEDEDYGESFADKDQNALNLTGELVSRRLGGAPRRRTLGAQTSPALPLHIREARKPRLSEDPFGQQDVPSSIRDHSPYQSTPALSSSRTQYTGRLSSFHTADHLLQKYDFGVQMHLLRSHFCRSEIQFILALENISNRLLVVPKPARISALRAELTGLNHLLPAEVCMPMWCGSSDALLRGSRIPHPHHRIVRIPPGESVVLNSAEHAPYLLLVEILNGDLDFDPVKRSNKEVLKRIVLKEEERRGASKDLITFNGSPIASRPPVVPQPHGATDDVFGADTADDDNDGDDPILSAISSSHPHISLSPTDDDEEEIDLVEQLYGADSDLRGKEMDLSDSIVLPPPPKNKELDMAAWSRSSSIPPTPQTDSGSGPVSSHTPSLSFSRSASLASNTNNAHILSLDEYSERMRTAAVMLAQLNANLVRESTTIINTPGTPLQTPDTASLSSSLRWLPGTSWLSGSVTPSTNFSPGSSMAPAFSGLPSQEAAPTPLRMKLQYAEAAAIRNRIMDEMLALEEERMERMRENRIGEGGVLHLGNGGGIKSEEDEGIIRRELSRADPSAVVFSESWAAKKSRIRQSSPYGHLATWDCVSVIVKTGGDLRQEQLAVQLIQEFERIWKDENCACWVRYFRILITGNSSGLVETITDAVSIHSIKKSEYARRLAEGRLGHVSLLDHFKTTYGDPSSAKFARAQLNFAKSLAGYSLVTYFLQIKDRHNGNILLDRDGHLIHIDFGFMLSNTPGNIGFEAAPFKLPLEYIEVLGGVDSKPFREFQRLFREGFEAARKHCDRIITLVELMQKDSALPCFAALGEQTANQLRERFQQGLTQTAVEEHVQRLVDTSLGSNWTRLYDSYQYYSQSIL